MEWVLISVVFCLSFYALSVSFGALENEVRVNARERRKMRIVAICSLLVAIPVTFLEKGLGATLIMIVFGGFLAMGLTVLTMRDR